MYSIPINIQHHPDPIQECQTRNEYRMSSQNDLPHGCSSFLNIIVMGHFALNVVILPDAKTNSKVKVVNLMRIDLDRINNELQQFDH